MNSMVWCIGVLVHWCIGALVYWCIGVLVYDLMNSYINGDAVLMGSTIEDGGTVRDKGKDTPPSDLTAFLMAIQVKGKNLSSEQASTILNAYSPSNYQAQNLSDAHKFIQIRSDVCVS